MAFRNTSLAMQAFPLHAPALKNLLRHPSKHIPSPVKYGAALHGAVQKLPGG